MGLMNDALHLKLLALLLFTVAAAAQTKPGCNRTCGNMSIPYPFGTSENCYLHEWFFINCTKTSSSSSYGGGEGTTTQLIYGTNIPVLNISLNPPELTLSAVVSNHCYNSDAMNRQFTLNKFSISNTKNRFTVVGCDTYAYIGDMDSTFETGCMLSCSNKTSFQDGACSGVGCCQTSFPKAIRNYEIALWSYKNYTDVRYFNPCGHAFVAKEGSFNFSSQNDLLNLRNERRFPIVVDWAVDNQTCLESQKYLTTYACKQNSICEDSESGIGYYCLCKTGFTGNPYLHPGCQDINECDGENLCVWKCHNNVDRNYTCSCPRGYRGNGYINGSGCKFPIMEISLGKQAKRTKTT